MNNLVRGGLAAAAVAVVAGAGLYWGGAFGTWFWLDPTNDVVFVGMIQNVNGSVPNGGTPSVRVITPKLTYAALTDPRK